MVRFIDNDGKAIADPVAVLQAFVPNSVVHVRCLLKREEEKAVEGAEVAAMPNTESARSDISMLMPLSPGIGAVLAGCTVVRSLCEVARNTNFLSHTDRLNLLYVFAHMGDIGKQYLHQVMRWTYNYRYETTERFIQRVLDKPVGCNRLREVYAGKDFVRPCSCKFPMVKGTYPSPVLHAHAVGASVDVTIPKSMAAQSNSNVTVDAFHTHGQIRDLAQQMLTLNREKNRLEDEIEMCQQKLSTLFNILQIEAFEIDIGMLSREKKPAGGFAWKIGVE